MERSDEVIEVGVVIFDRRPSMNPARALRLLDERLFGNRPSSVESVEAMQILMDGLRRWNEAGGAISLDEAMGLRARGGVSPGRSLALDRRDALLRSVRAAVPEWSTMGAYAASKLMSLSARRYESDRWPRARGALGAPSAEPAATWWRILQSDLPIPAARRIQQILEAEIR